MIRYKLACPDHHQFEAWFSTSDAFEEQQTQGLLVCPVCGSTSVDRSLMAPAVSTARSKDSVRLAANVPDGGATEKQELIDAFRKLRKHLTDNAEHVGDRFAEEARRIHYNETEKRGIYGGGVGYISANGSMDTCICLRTAIVKDGVMYVQAGGGVVADSNPEAEFMETVHKSAALFRAADEAQSFVNAKPNR